MSLVHLVWLERDILNRTSEPVNTFLRTYNKGRGGHPPLPFYKLMEMRLCLAATLDVKVFAQYTGKNGNNHNHAHEYCEPEQTIGIDGCLGCYGSYSCRYRARCC